ncbi:MAG: HAMP domain-containing histidine kinase, partial [Oscillospiraceae bacterium]|nr:HAMP domain-containing histidine kinase [Oscillospiraceae bacterium]
MTKTLQKRFVFSAMLAITVLLVFLLGAINIAHGVATNRQVERILDTLTVSRGAYTPPNESGERQPRFPRRAPTPDAMMGARFFLVVFDEQMQAVHSNVKHIYAVSEEEALNLARSACAAGRGDGRVDRFAYRVSDAPDGKGSLAVFLDVSAQQSSVRALGLAACGVGLLCWLAMLLLVIFISRRAIAPIAENIERQKQFVTNAGHEIKTPLAIILANTDAMELINGENKWSRNIRAQTNRLSGLMQNLLTLARMDEQSELPRSELSLTQLLEEALELYGEAAAGKKLTLKTRLEEVELRANRESMLQLVSALLDNAVKYTAEGGEVCVSLTPEEGGAELRVENDCAEAPAEDMERLFDRFYRGDAART